MSYSTKVASEEQEQYTYENGAEARRIVPVDGSGNVVNLGGLVPEKYDYIILGYTGFNMTSVVYKTGGSGGTTVATITLTYSGAQILTITKT